MDSDALVFPTPVRYAEGVRIQEALLSARLADRIPDTVLLLEHRPVVTLGRRARDRNLLATPEDLARDGIDFHVASRGGDITYHAPGQAVVYPILKLGEREADAHGYLHNLEETAIRTAATFGVSAHRRPGMAGAWTDQGKIAAIGFSVKRWVTCHGMSLNVDLDLSGFERMVPCGLAGEPVASLATLLGAACPTMEGVFRALADRFGEVMARPLHLYRIGLDALPRSTALLLHDFPSLG